MAAMVVCGILKAAPPRYADKSLGIPKDLGARELNHRSISKRFENVAKRFDAFRKRSKRLDASRKRVEACRSVPDQLAQSNVWDANSICRNRTAREE